MNINELTNPEHTSIVGKITDLLDMVSSETELAYNPVNGNVIFINILGSEFDDDEEFEDEEELTDEYLYLPTQYEIHEYAMMEEFSDSYPDNHKRTILLNTLQGRHVFRRFKDMLIVLGIRDEWFAFRDTAYRAIAERWCIDNNLISVTGDTV